MRITQLQDQGYSLSHASMKTVEWALSKFPGECAFCARHLLPPLAYVDETVHRWDCPIPALGYAVLHEQGWMRRRCRGCGSVIDEDGKECDGYGD